MAITSTIVVDEIAGTAIGNVYLNGITLLETVTYTNSTLEITLVEHGQVPNVGIVDFRKLLDFYVIFNNAIIASLFGPSQFQYVPFASIDRQLSNDSVDQLEFTYQFTPNDSLPLFQYTCTYPNGTVIVQKRSPDATLSYAQWLDYLYQIAQFRTFVLNAYTL